METRKQRTCIVKQVQIVMKIIIMQIQVNMEMRFMKRARAVAHRGTAITLTFLTRAFLSSGAEAVTIMVRLQACSVSTTAVVLATATIRSVRSWSHFNVNLKYTSKTRAKTLKTLENDKTNGKSFKNVIKRLKTQNGSLTILHTKILKFNMIELNK